MMEIGCAKVLREISKLPELNGFFSSKKANEFDARSSSALVKICLCRQLVSESLYISIV